MKTTKYMTAVAIFTFIALTIIKALFLLFIWNWIAINYMHLIPMPWYIMWCIVIIIDIAWNNAKK